MIIQAMMEKKADILPTDMKVGIGGQVFPVNPISIFHYITLILIMLTLKLFVSKIIFVEYLAEELRGIFHIVR